MPHRRSVGKGASDVVREATRSARLTAVDADAIVVGAGVVGLACAERIARAGRSVVVVESHATFGRETSSRNSEVIHSGIYYPTGSLKAALCLEGNGLLYDWCAEHRVAHAAVGKYIVATCEAEEPVLDRLLAQAHTNGAVEVARVSGDVVRRAEPCGPRERASSTATVSCRAWPRERARGDACSRGSTGSLPCVAPRTDTTCR